MKINNGLASSVAHPVSLLSIFRSEWKLWLCGAISCFVLASVLMSGWPSGLIPNLDYPYIYSGDGLSHSWLAERAIEGWIFNNPRSGYPFGSNFLDYPGSDSGNLLLLKILGQLTGNYYAALNLYFLTGFAVTFISAYCVMRALGVRVAFAFVGAFLFNFIPFHFERLGHLFYTWYFVAPLYFYLAFKVFGLGSEGEARIEGRQVPRWLMACGLMVLGCFGVYYAAFGLILLGVALVANVANRGSLKAVKFGVLSACFVLLGVLLNLAPNIVYQKHAGINPEVAQRNPADAEVLGLKFVQLLMPRADHRVHALARVAEKYNASFPLINENSTAGLGLVGSAGFIGILLVTCAVMAGRKMDRNLRLAALMSFVLFMFGTIGGLGALFSQVISSSIRGWNRISIFIAFGSLLVFFMVLQALLAKYLNGRRIAILACAALVMLVGLFDQTVPACQGCIAQTRTAFELDRNFVGAIEKSLPTGSAIYQLPYMPFPEVVPKFRLQTYDLAAGFLHSRSLKWNYAGMKGRDGDGFYRALSREPVEKQVDVIRRLGFAGVYIDRRGYEDNGAAVIQRFADVLGVPPALERADKEVVFFSLGKGGVPHTALAGLSNVQLLQKADFIADHLGLRYAPSLAEGIDFKRAELPLFLKNIDGISGVEPWGRWSDANVAPAVRIEFNEPLPHKFTLVLTAHPFGPNVNQEMAVRVGAQTLKIKLHDGDGDYRQVVDLGNEQVTRIELVPAKPTSPSELGLSADGRKLGIGLVRLAID